MRNGIRSARSGDSRTRTKPPMSNTGALIANVSLRCFDRLYHPSVVGSNTYKLPGGQHRSTRFGAFSDTGTRVLG